MTLETQITQQQYNTKQQTHKVEKKHQRNAVGALLRKKHQDSTYKVEMKKNTNM